MREYPDNIIYDLVMRLWRGITTIPRNRFITMLRKGGENFTTKVMDKLPQYDDKLTISCYDAIITISEVNSYFRKKWKKDYNEVAKQFNELV